MIVSIANGSVGSSPARYPTVLGSIPAVVEFFSPVVRANAFRLRRLAHVLHNDADWTRRRHTHTHTHTQIPYTQRVRTGTTHRYRRTYCICAVCLSVVCIVCVCVCLYMLCWDLGNNTSSYRMQLGAVVECSLPTVVVTGSIPGVFFPNSCE